MKNNHKIETTPSTGRRRGLLLLLVLLAFASISVMMVFPLRITRADAPLEEFSAERALAHLPIIANEPHPEGSAAQARVREYLAGQLTDMGLELEIQQEYTLANVVGRLRGTDPTGAIVLLAHYDTVSFSSGAGDNGSAVSALLEIMRALASGPTPRNDIIVLFDDGEELPGAFSGTYLFVRKHPWMSTVRVAISLDTAVAGPISTNEVGPENGWFVGVLAEAYNGGAWTSFSGGGQYNSTPFREAGYLVLALEDNYPFREKHTRGDLPSIIHPASVQQMGEQTLAIARVLGRRDLTDTWGKQETFFALPLLGLVHYPETWSLPLAVTAGVLLVLAIGLALWSRLVTWRGLLLAFASIILLTLLCVVLVTLLMPALPKLFGWQTSQWPDWPEVIPPYGGWVVLVLGLLVLALTVAGYSLVRRWCGRPDFSLAGLVPFAVAAIILSIVTPRAAYAFLWPVMLGSLGWITAGFAGRKNIPWSVGMATLLAALPLVILLLPFLPGVVMSDGMKSLNILAAFEVLMLCVFLPVVDGLLSKNPKILPKLI